MNMENLPTIRIVALLHEPNLNAFLPHVLCIENTLEGLRKTIGCRCVACTEFEVEGKNYDVWSDDEALLKDKPIPSLYINNELILFGNLVLAKHDEEGETLGLTVSDILWLKKYFGR